MKVKFIRQPSPVTEVQISLLPAQYQNLKQYLRLVEQYRKQIEYPFFRDPLLEELLNVLEPLPV